MQIPPYVGLGGNVEFSPPITADGVRMYGFLLPADRRHLDRAFDARFNEPSGGAVLTVSAVPFVLFYVSVIPNIRMHENVGWYRERETGVMMFGLDLTHDRLFTTLDYLFVDSGQAMANGREIFGFPKQIGDFTGDDEWLEDPEIAVPPGNPDGFRLETLGVDRFGPHARARRHELWHLERTNDEGRPTPITDPTAMVRLVGDAMRAVAAPHVVDDTLHPFLHDEPSVSVPYRSPLGDGGYVSLDPHPYHSPNPLAQGRMPLPGRRAVRTGYHLLEELAQNRLGTLLLKQVRSAAVPGAAAFQSILHLDASRTMRSMGVLPAQYRLHVNTLASAPMADTFGWQDRSHIDSVMSVYTEYDFEYGLGRTLWSATPSV